MRDDQGVPLALVSYRVKIFLDSGTIFFHDFTNTILDHVQDVKNPTVTDLRDESIIDERVLKILDHGFSILQSILLYQ